MTCEFTYDHYIETIDKLIQHTQLVIRHDVDISLEKATGFAKLEHEHDIQSWYFIMFDSLYYSPLTETNMKRLQTIKKYGHRIGLHYSNLGETSTNIAKLIHNKREILETIIDYPVTMMSQHKVELGKKIDPAVLEALKFIGLKDINKFLPDFKYISDSAQYWREGCMCQHIDRHEKLMILVHPIWWNDRHTNRTQVISNWHTHEVIKRQNVYKREMADLSIYDKKVKGI